MGFIVLNLIFKGTCYVFNSCLLKVIGEIEGRMSGRFILGLVVIFFKRWLINYSRLCLLIMGVILFNYDSSKLF